MIKVRLFSILKDYAGVDHVELDVREDVSVKDIINMLLKKLPGLRKAFEVVREEQVNVIVLVNGEPVDLNRVVRDGDEVALVPPASGG